MKYFVVGATGQLGMEVVQLLEERNEDYVAFSSSELDITNRERVFKFMLAEKPDVVLDVAAYTAVDAAEDDGKQRNWEVNSEGTNNLAESAAAVGATIIYISTDYVFSGMKESAYLETDNTNPKNEYGKAKLSGEIAVERSGAEYYIIRTSWVFGEFGNNFVFTMKKLSEQLDTINVVSDQKGRPTWTRTLAEFMVHLILTKSEKGIYHLSNDGDATWYEFAKEILADSNVSVQPITSKQFPTKAYRPQNSVLDLSKAKSTGFEIITWKEALSRFELNLINSQNRMRI